MRRNKPRQQGAGAGGCGLSAAAGGTALDEGCYTYISEAEGALGREEVSVLPPLSYSHEMDRRGELLHLGETSQPSTSASRHVGGWGVWGGGDLSSTCYVRRGRGAWSWGARLLGETRAVFYIILLCFLHFFFAIPARLGVASELPASTLYSGAYVGMGAWAWAMRACATTAQTAAKSTRRPQPRRAPRTRRRPAPRQEPTSRVWPPVVRRRCSRRRPQSQSQSECRMSRTLQHLTSFC